MAASWLLALAALAVPVEAPITAVTVYSDQARVTRTARVALQGSVALELPLLPDGVDPGSVRVEAEGAEVQRVELAFVPAEAFPRDRALALLEHLQALDDQLALAASEREATAAQVEALRRLTPTAG